MDEKMKARRKIVTVIALVLAAAFLTFTFINISKLSQKSTYVLESASEAQFARDGKSIVIDNGKKTLLVFDKNGRITHRYDGGTESDAFFYA